MTHPAEHPDPASKQLLSIWQSIPENKHTISSTNQSHEFTTDMAVCERHAALLKSFNEFIETCTKHRGFSDVIDKSSSEKIGCYPWEQPWDSGQGLKWSVKFAQAALQLPHFLEDAGDAPAVRKHKILARVKEHLPGHEDLLDEAFREAAGLSFLQLETENPQVIWIGMIQ